MRKWNSQILTQQSKNILRSQHSILHFAKDPYMMDQSLWVKQKEILSKFYTKYPDGSPIYNELIVYAGMRSSKTYMAGLVGAYEAFQLLSLKDPAVHWGLAPGSEIFIINVAANERQSRDTIFAQTKARIHHSPFFQQFDYTEHHDEFIFPSKAVIIRAGGSNSGSIVGKTVKCALFDELTRFKDNDGRFSGKMSFESLGRSTKTFLMDGKKVVVGSPIYDGDVIMQLMDEAKGLSNVLTYTCATWEINPNITEKSLEDERRRNPEAYWRDFGARPPRATDDYFRERQYLKTNPFRLNWEDYIWWDEKEEGYIVNPPKIWPGKYILAGDPAIKNDAFGLSIAHKSRFDDKITFDLLHRFVPGEDKSEIDAYRVKEYIMALVEKIPIEIAVFDTWMFPSVIQGLAKLGVEVVQHIVRKPEYDELKSYFYLDRNFDYLDICHYPFVLIELKHLLIIRGAKVDHPKMMKDIEGLPVRGSKDVSDAMANAIWGLVQYPKLKKKRKKKVSHLVYKRY